MNMIKQRQKNMLSYLKGKTSPSACSQIAFHCSCSINSIRKDILEFNEQYSKEAGFIIDSFKAKGYIIKIIDQNRASRFFEEMDLYKNRVSDRDFDAFENYRAYYIVRALLIAEKKIPLQQFSEDLFCSKSTVIRELKKAENYLKQFRIKVIHSKAGLYIEGSELDIRICLVFQLKIFRMLDVEKKDLETRFLNTFYLKNTEYQTINKVVSEVLLSVPNYHISRVNLPKIIQFISLLQSRQQHESELLFTDEQVTFLRRSEFSHIAVSILKKINYENTDKRILILTAVLESYRSISDISELSDEERTSSRSLAGQLTNYLYRRFNTTIIYDKEFNDALICHLPPFSARCLFGIPNDSEFYADIVNRPSYINDFAVAYSRFFEETMHLTANDSLVYDSYYLFNDLFFRYSRDYMPLNVLLVSKYGIEHGKVVAERLMKIYGMSYLVGFSHIQNIDVVEYSSVSLLYKNYDFMLTNIDKSNFNVRFPVFEIDMSANFVKDKTLGDIFYRLQVTQLFFYLNNNISKSDFSDFKDVFEDISKRVSNGDESLKEAIRESLEKKTEYISPVFSHQLSLISVADSVVDDPLIYIYLNKKTILWNDEEAQLIVFYNYGKDTDRIAPSLDYLFSRLSEKTIHLLLDCEENNLSEYLYTILQ